MKKFKLIISFLVLFSGFQVAFAEVLKVGATPIPHAQILNFIVPALKKEGIDLKVIEFTDYVTPNLALADKSLDANFMQHEPYLKKFDQDRGLNLIAIAKIHVEPLGFYSKKIKSIDELKDGATIAIPNDPSNGGRALILLHNHGLIKLKDPTNLYATEFDIIENPKKIKIRPLEAAMLSKSLNDVDGAVINGNYALQAGLKTKDAIFTEGPESPYANVLVVRKGDENRPSIIKLKNALQSEEVRKFILDTYQGEIVPAF
ncbi:MetQ/NlpA family ABC transporter substrate-binding protein [Helicobacter cappadocius]|uniref:MetQ/NlpA family ABC transporter substrate-binding protein n=1 Tax=Helicobacter cappadocius TaxID=3063998 RepID=A0AA90PT97_9HELI|nr:MULTISPECIES: MetQ/NlpA family ABC transporter substrate-binding protein [unclassified Helicobacter]MDO7253190.1 MetQ/NlpA family ABC transporter substrate-binding protein [Helicobacter sp. faydin-H75]MDP2539114.1 MetQ/NlpA family ABC transporter substrate-binding protein [Helicobacter sp. faydin-H76]